MIIFLKNRFNFVKSLCSFYWLFLCKGYDLLLLSTTKFNKTNFNVQESFVYSYFIKSSLKDAYAKIIFSKNFLTLDLVLSYFFSTRYNYETNLSTFRSYFRVLQTKQGFYFNFSTLLKNTTFLDQLKISLNSGWKYVWLGLRFWVLSLVVALGIVYYSMVIRCLPFTKTVFVWVISAMFAYWLISGFVFFIKKYQFGKYTSVIQRFWRRSYILFWLIEIFVFGVYIYLTVNANQESFYMFDQIQVFKTHLFSWRSFLFKLFPLTFLLIIGYLFLLSLKWNVLGKHVLWLAGLTYLLTYITWIEFYQFFHVVNYYGNLNWIYDADERNWTLELEPKKTRTVNHYVMLMIMLKFWHIAFIFAFWVFFVLRSLEIGRVRYPLLSANLQNFIILYLFAWVIMYPWLKFVLRRYLDMPYYWFYINNRELGYRIFFCDFKLFYYGLMDFVFYNYSNLINVFNMDFFYWSLLNEDNFCTAYRKSAIKNIILGALSK